MTPKSIFAAVLVFLPIPALAQTFDASGVWTGTSASVTHAVSDDLVAVHINVTHDRLEPTSPDNPAADATGQCFGALLIQAGQASGSGNCHYVDGDGDMLITEWTAEGIDADGWTTGRWALIEGTGKWSGASGGGSYRAGPDAMNEITGEMTLN